MWQEMYSTWQCFKMISPYIHHINLSPLAVNVYTELDLLLSCLQRERCLVACFPQSRVLWFSDKKA